MNIDGARITGAVLSAAVCLASFCGNARAGSGETCAKQLAGLHDWTIQTAGRVDNDSCEDASDVIEVSGDDKKALRFKCDLQMIDQVFFGDVVIFKGPPTDKTWGNDMYYVIIEDEAIFLRIADATSKQVPKSARSSLIAQHSTFRRCVSQLQRRKGWKIEATGIIVQPCTLSQRVLKVSIGREVRSFECPLTGANDVMGPAVFLQTPAGQEKDDRLVVGDEVILAFPVERQ